MSSVGSEVMQAFLGRGRLGLAAPGQAVVWEAVTDASTGAHRLFHLIAALHESKTSRLRLWLSGALAKPFRVGPIAGLTNWGEVKRLAQSLAPSATGHESPCDVWLSGDPTQEAIIAVAVERRLLELLAAQARESRTRIVSIRPWWTQALAPPSEMSAPWLVAIDDGEALTVLHREAEAWAEPATYWPRPERDQIATLLMRKAAAGNLQNEFCHFVEMGEGTALQPQNEASLPFPLRWTHLDALREAIPR